MGQDEASQDCPDCRGPEPSKGHTAIPRWVLVACPIPPSPVIHFRSSSFSQADRALAPLSLPFRSWATQNPATCDPLLTASLSFLCILRRPAGSFLLGAQTSNPTLWIETLPP